MPSSRLGSTALKDLCWPGCTLPSSAGEPAKLACSFSISALMSAVIRARSASGIVLAGRRGGNSGGKPARRSLAAVGSAPRAWLAALFGERGAGGGLMGGSPSACLALGRGRGGGRLRVVEALVKVGARTAVV